MVRIDVVTLFPEMFAALTGHGIVARALQRGLWSLQTWNPRDFADNAYRRVDDRPYGGGPGMVMMPGPLSEALRAIRASRCSAGAEPAAGPVICLSPQGEPVSDALVRSLAVGATVTLIAGRYEGIDQRFLDRHVDREVCVGDFVVSGGELPAMMLIDAVVRLLPGALNDADSGQQDSFADGLLDCPHYTRPDCFEGEAVPGVLLSGDHARIARWRRDQALRLTAARRPDLIERARRAGRLDARDEAVLATPSGPGDEDR